MLQTNDSPNYSWSVDRRLVFQGLAQKTIAGRMADFDCLEAQKTTEAAGSVGGLFPGLAVWELHTHQE
jgi:hypothetical protein